MPGITIKLKTQFTDTSLPRLLFDPVIPISGAVMLYEPGHPENPFLSAPVHNAVLPNLVADQNVSRGLNGPQTAHINIQNHTAKTLVEMSAKGGIHMALGTLPESALNRMSIRVDNQAFADFFNANKSHNFYHSVWRYVTRASDPAGTANTHWDSIGDTSNRQLAHFYAHPTGVNGETVYPANARRINAFVYGAAGSSTAAVNPTATGPAMWAAETGPFTVNIIAGGFGWNMIRPGWAPQTYGSNGIFYRAYVEDLTVSGRTFAQVKALDFNEFTRQVLTPGGRYYNDTYSAAPS